MRVEQNKPGLNEQAFANLLKALGLEGKLDASLLFEAYGAALHGFSVLLSQNQVLSGLPVNTVQLTLYLANEHLFYLGTHPEAKEEDLRTDEKYLSFLSSVALDKYITNEHLSFQNGRYGTRFSPELSTLNLYLNFILGMLSRYKRGDPKETLIVDIMAKAFQLSKCIVLLLTHGYETEAFSTWRTLHENECILTVLIKYGKDAVERYNRHLTYAMAFRGGLGSKEKTDECFVEIKEGMREAGLKSKDMKRYIEYGWLLAVPGAQETEGFKFNFRDGVERLAGLHDYSKVYEMSSEIAHSSPLLIYSRKNYFYLVALLNLYDSFNRLEKIFSTIYLNSVEEAERNRYLTMRKLYFPQMKTAYAILRGRLEKLGNKS